MHRVPSRRQAPGIRLDPHGLRPPEAPGSCPFLLPLVSLLQPYPGRVMMSNPHSHGGQRQHGGAAAEVEHPRPFQGFRTDPLEERETHAVSVSSSTSRPLGFPSVPGAPGSSAAGPSASSSSRSARTRSAGPSMAISKSIFPLNPFSRFIYKCNVRQILSFVTPLPSSRGERSPIGPETKGRRP